MQRKIRLALAATVSILTSCSSGVDAICDDALHEFYRCGGAPQIGDMDACIDRYETASYGCAHAFRDRLDCTDGIACGSEDTVCGDVLNAEDQLCGGDPIVPPY